MSSTSRNYCLCAQFITNAKKKPNVNLIRKHHHLFSLRQSGKRLCDPTNLNLKSEKYIQALEQQITFLIIKFKICYYFM